MLDAIILGGGPAGISAGIYAARKKMEFKIVTPEIGGQAVWSGDIENYTGFTFISGQDLAAKFQEHIRKYGIEILEGDRAVAVKPGKGFFETTTAAGKRFESRTVIVATGKKAKKLDVPGADEFFNKGVAYCVTCDGPLFSDKDIAVVGGGNSALEAAVQMERIANHVYVIDISKSFAGDGVLVDRVKASPKCTVMHETEVREISGEGFVSSLTVSGPGGTKRLKVQGVFVEIGMTPNSDICCGIEKNDYGEIVISSRNETNIPGLFAAGDVTDIPEKQIIVAAGEGAKATLSAFKYISRLSH